MDAITVLILYKAETGQVQSPDLVCEESEVGLRQAVKSFAFKVILKNVFRQVFSLLRNLTGDPQ